MIRAGLAWLLMLAFCGLTAAQATEMNLYLATDSGIEDKIVVCPGATLIYTVTGHLSDTASQGLAGFSFDVNFGGGNLTQASPGPFMGSCFVGTLGFTNPAGFGGRTDVTGREGNLVQVGGAQNTINNTAANTPSPIGPICLDVCETPTILAAGTLVAPSTPGTHTLSIPAGSVRANVIAASTTGDPFWAVEPAPLGTNSKLALTVEVVGECRPTITHLDVFYAGRYLTCFGGDNEGMACFTGADCPESICRELIDPTYTFFAAGGLAQLNNVTRYVGGITGIRMKFNLAVDFETSPWAALSFEWTTGEGTTFTSVPDAATIVATATVEDGVTVVMITFNDDHVKRRYLKVTVDATQVTSSDGVEDVLLDGDMTGSPVALPSGDSVPDDVNNDAIFYIANVPGDVNDNQLVSTADLGAIRAEANPFIYVGITNIFDVDKDEMVVLDDVEKTYYEVDSGFQLPGFIAPDNP